jgi:hypothetical protein
MLMACCIALVLCWCRYLTDPSGTMKRQAQLARSVSSMTQDQATPALADMFGSDGGTERAQSTERYGIIQTDTRVRNMTHINRPCHHPADQATTGKVQRRGLGATVLWRSLHVCGFDSVGVDSLRLTLPQACCSQP